jgi:hypothetical protein
MQVPMLHDEHQSDFNVLAILLAITACGGLAATLAGVLIDNLLH